MRAWAVTDVGPVSTRPLRAVDRDPPVPGPGEVRIRMATCGVCRTDLHLAEGDLPPRRPGVVPGHEVVGVVDQRGPGAERFEVDARIGVPWLRRTCGRCRFCASERENLCLSPEFTAWDADGGFAEYCTVPEGFAYDLSRFDGVLDDEHVAPLLCAGIIGYRALRLAGAGDALGLYGFGASAHLGAQVAVHLGARVHVMTRGRAAQERALALGAASAQGADEPPPEPLQAAVLFAPAGSLVPRALAALDRGGTLAIAGIHLTDVPPLVYERHLFYDRTLRSVTANTRADGEEFLRLAAEIPIQVTTTPFPLDQADVALEALADGRVNGAAVLLND